MNTLLHKFIQARFLLTAVLLAALLALPANAQEPVRESRFEGSSSRNPSNLDESMQVNFRSQSGGVSSAVAISGSYAYVGLGSRLLVISISDPTKPTEVGRTGLLGGVVQDIMISGSYAYVAGSEGGLRVVSIANPAAPVEVGYYVTPGYSYSIAISGNYAYVADGYTGLRVINISNPLSPWEAGFFDTAGFAGGVAISGNYAFVADDSAGIVIINISNPANPQQVGSLATAGNAFNIAVSGSYAYVAAYTSGLRIIDISNLAAPFEKGFYATPGYAMDVVVSGSYAYVADSYMGLRIINITNPSNPTQTGYIDTPGYVYDLRVSASYAYLADHYGGFRIISISNLQSPSQVGFYDPALYPVDIDISGSTAYVATGNEGLHILDVSNPNSPIVIGYYDTPGYAEAVVVSGKYAFVANYNYGLRILNISNPSSPVEVGFYDSDGFTLDVAVNGNYAYLADYNDSYKIGLRIIDISNPASPSLVGTVATPGSISSVAVSGNYAYVADGYSGLRIIDVSTPAAPEEVGFLDTPGYAYGIAVSSNFAYVADGEYGLRIINVIDPKSPVEVGFYNTPGAAYGVTISGAYAFVADYGAGLQIINITIPAAPIPIAAFSTHSISLSVAVSGTLVYVAAASDGVYILQACLLPETPILSSPQNGLLTKNDLVAFSWNDTIYGSSYQLEVDDNLDFMSPTVVLTTTVPYYPGYIQFPDDSYYWRVRADNFTEGCSVPGAYSSAWTFTIDTIPPSPPTLTSPVSGAVTNDTTPAFSWGPSSGAAQYQIQADNSSGYGSPEINVTTAAVSHTSATALAYGTYSWHVAARDAAGNWSSFSTERSFTIMNPPAAFNKQAPWDGQTNISVDQDLTVSWGTSTRATLFEYCIDTTNDNACSTNWIGVGNNTSALVPGLKTATTYYWQVRSSNADIPTYSNFGTWWKFTTFVPNVYLPLIIKIVPTYFEGPGEMENNDSIGAANGPIRSEQNYTGAFEDTNDYFFFNTSSTGTISVVLDYTGDAQQLGVSLQLFNDIPASIGFMPGPEPHLFIDIASLPAGRYYVRVYSANPGAGSYTLKVTYP